MVIVFISFNSQSNIYTQTNVHTKDITNHVKEAEEVETSSRELGH